MRKNLLESKKMQLLSRFWTNSLCHFFWRRSLAELSKLQSTSPWKFLKKNFIWCFVHCFKLVWTLPKKKEHWSRSFLQVCHNCHLLVIAIIWKKNHFFFCINSYFPSFKEFEQFFRLLAKKLVKYVKSAFYVHKWRNLLELISEKKKILTSFLELGQKNFRLLLDNFGKKFKTSFYVSRRTHTEHLFWKRKLKLSFFSDFRRNFWDNGKKILQVYQNCRNCPEERLEEKSFLREELTTSSSFWWNSFFTSCAKDRQNCQNCSLCSLGRFWGRTLFEFLHNVSNFFGLWAKK